MSCLAISGANSACATNKILSRRLTLNTIGERTVGGNVGGNELS